MSDTISDSTPQKQCRTCEKPFPATKEFFHSVPTYASPDGLHAQCKTCRSETRKGKHGKKGPKPVEIRHTELGFEVSLTQGKYTLVDECDLDLFEGCK